MPQAWEIGTITNSSTVQQSVCIQSITSQWFRTMITQGSLSFHCRVLRPDDNASCLGNRHHHQSANCLIVCLYVTQTSLKQSCTGFKEDSEKHSKWIQQSTQHRSNCMHSADSSVNTVPYSGFNCMHSVDSSVNIVPYSSFNCMHSVRVINK